MPPRRNKEKFQQLTEFERGKILSAFSRRRIFLSRNRSSCALDLQWTDEHRTTRKTSSGRRKVTSVPDDRHQLRMAVNDRRASSRQLAALWSTATGVLMSASSIRRRLLHSELLARVPLYWIPLTANYRRLHLQWAHEHRAWQAD
ncbi:transposable element Tc1 transposase [Trichonephila clavipes]|nr:transposable element Tc1 transposase [Trichonephila clavipes]